MIRLKKIIALALVLAGTTTTLGAQNTGLPDHPLFARKYKPGETYRYKMTLNEYHNGALDFTNVAVCELKVVDSAGVFYDEVHWKSKKVFRAKDTTDQTQAATQVKPYRISLSGKGRIDMPKIDVPDMTEPIQDFNTFFVGVSPLIQGMDRLKQSGDSVSTATPVIGDFSNGDF